MIQSYRVEIASNASMPLYTTQGIFVYRGTQLDKQHIVQRSKATLLSAIIKVFLELIRLPSSMKSSE